MKQRILTAVVILSALSLPTLAQPGSDVLNGVYIKENVPTNNFIKYPQGSLMREADLMWTKRVWRRIDLRQKFNHPMNFPSTPTAERMSLFDIIRQGILENGTITPYDPGPLNDDDNFTRVMTREEVEDLLNPTEAVMSTNLFDPSVTDTVLVEDPVEASDILFYEIKEDWLFDKQRSVMECRIIGICPMIKRYGPNGEYRGVTPLFWLYFPQARREFANHEVFFGQNDMSPLSYDDVFYKRRFQSYVVKESNVYDRYIGEYATGIDALLESENVTDKIRNMEHDLFSY